MAIELTPGLVRWAETVADSVARRIPPVFDRADLRAIAVLACWRATRQFDAEQYPGVPFEGYAYARVRGAVYDKVRYRNWRVMAERPLDPRIPDQSGRLEDRLDVGRATERVWEVVKMLRPEWQTLARLIWLDGCTIREVAVQMQIPRSRASYWRRQVLMAIRAELLENHEHSNGNGKAS